MTPDPVPRPPGAGDLVLLLHGLGRSGRSMAALASALGAAGYRARTWDYASRRHALAELVALFARHLDEMGGHGGKVHFVGHSLGALVIRGALSKRPPVPVGRVVMIAPPNRGVGIARRLRGVRPFEWLYGRAFPDLAGEARDLAWLGTPPAEVGIIAGTRRFHPLNPASYVNVLVNRARHDGTVEVEHTGLPGMADFLALAVDHIVMCSDLEVVRQTLAFLERGAFDHGPKEAAAEATEKLGRSLIS